MKRPALFSRILATLLAGLMAAPLLAQSKSEENYSPRAIRDELRPVYEALLADEEYLALKADVDKDPENVEKLERYLRKLPASPMTLLQLNMEMFYYEHVVPSFMTNLHGQWIQLNEEKARALYGDEHVDQWLYEVKQDPDTGKPVPQKITWVGTNRNVAATFPTTPEDYQGEIQLMVNPNNPKQMVAAANTWDRMNGTCGYGIQAVFYSSDGGASWGYTCAPDESAYTSMSCPWPFIVGSDPAIAWNDNDEVFLNYMLLCLSGTGTTKFSMVVAKSTNGGANWTGQGVIKDSWSTSDIEDKNFYIIDNTSTSPYYGRHYTCWDRNNDEKMAYSSDGGATWTEVDLPTTTGSGSGTRYDLGCDLAVGSNGDVHIVFDTLSCGTSSCNNEEMFYTQSTDGGATWSTPVEVRDFTLVAFGTGNTQNAQNDRGIGPFGGIAIDNSGGACDGTLYAFFSDTTSNANNSDVFVSRSTNNGVTWNAPVKVNDDGLSNRIQFHPFAQVDQKKGHLVIGWHDARNDTANRAIDFYLARSTNCGVSFEPNIQVSQPSAEFNNNTISYSNENSVSNTGYNPNQYGEYLGLDTINCRAYMAWTDTRHYFPSSAAPSSFQKENLGFAVIDLDCPSTCGPGSCISGMFCDSCGCHDVDSDISRAFCECGLLNPACGIGECVGDGYCEGPYCPAPVCWAPFTPQSQVMCGGASLDAFCNVVKNDCGPGYCTFDGRFCDSCTCFPQGSNISKLFCQCGLLDPTCGLGECYGTNYCEGPHCAAPVCYISTVPMSMGMCGGFELDASCNPY